MSTRSASPAFSQQQVDPAVALGLVEDFDARRNKEPFGREEVVRLSCDIAEREADRRDGSQ